MSKSIARVVFPIVISLGVIAGIAANTLGHGFVNRAYVSLGLKAGRTAGQAAVYERKSIQQFNTSPFSDGQGRGGCHHDTAPIDPED